MFARLVGPNSDTAEAGTLRDDEVWDETLIVHQQHEGWGMGHVQ